MARLDNENDKGISIDYEVALVPLQDVLETVDAAIALCSMTWASRPHHREAHEENLKRIWIAFQGAIGRLGAAERALEEEARRKGLNVFEWMRNR